VLPNFELCESRAGAAVKKEMGGLRRHPLSALLERIARDCPDPNLIYFSRHFHRGNQECRVRYVRRGTSGRSFAASHNLRSLTLRMSAQLRTIAFLRTAIDVEEYETNTLSASNVNHNRPVPSQQSWRPDFHALRTRAPFSCASFRVLCSLVYHQPSLAPQDHVRLARARQALAFKCVRYHSNV